MGRAMPRQKPGQSETTVLTPPVFLDAVKGLLGITTFDIDLAADASNAVTTIFFHAGRSALDRPAVQWVFEGWDWCNPPYDHIAPWVEMAVKAKREGAKIAMLVPASVGSNWWDDYVHDHAMVLFLKGRITFNDKHGRPICSPKTGKPTPYPKDLALLLYAHDWAPGYLPWAWK